LRRLTIIVFLISIHCLPKCIYKPFKVSEIDKILGSPTLKGTTVGILFVSEEGETIFSKNPERLLVPASNEKIILTGALLHHLGPNFTFKTLVLLDSVMNLYLVGGGDPLLSVGDLYEMGLRLKEMGISKVETLFVGESYLDIVRYQPGWTYFEAGSPYAPPLGGLSLNRNLIEVKRNSRGLCLTFPPIGPFFQELDLPPLERETTFTLPAKEPAVFVGWAFFEILLDLGIEVEVGVFKCEPPSDCDTLLIYLSPPLSEVIRVMNKWSDNFVAEMLLKDLGREVFGPPGTREKGVRAVHLYLTKLGIDTLSLRIVEGSGLSRYDLLSASHIVRVLLDILRRFDFSAEFLSSLPISGTDGTLKERLSFFKGMVRAKTGTLWGISSLSGVAVGKGGRKVIFSILINNFTSDLEDIREVQDSILSSILAP